jgi:hypothetical protein
MGAGRSDYSSASHPVIRVRYCLVGQVRDGPYWREVSSESDRDDIREVKLLGKCLM